jgi:1,4-dihydroxy-2-naphthoate octaprenyltransferase
MARTIDVVFAGACLLALVGWLWFSSGLTFYNDEWDVIRAVDDWSFDRLMQRHVEHWALGLRVMWTSLMSIVGMSTYMPYLAMAVLFHIATAVGIYVLARRQTVAIAALGLGALFLFFGSGAHNLSMGFQMGWNAGRRPPARYPCSDGGARPRKVKMM